jgi:multidrug transporter EmrE-like cation transporter
MINFLPVVFATTMATIDVLVLGWMKNYTIGMTSPFFVLLGMILYGLQPAIFLQSLKYESMTVMNIMWDLISDILVTVTGLFYFKEKLSSIKMFALVLAFTSIVLFSYDEWKS